MLNLRKVPVLFLITAISIVPTLSWSLGRNPAIRTTSRSTQTINRPVQHLTSPSSRRPGSPKWPSVQLSGDPKASLQPQPAPKPTIGSRITSWFRGGSPKTEVAKLNPQSPVKLGKSPQGQILGKPTSQPIVKLRKTTSRQILGKKATTTQKPAQKLTQKPAQKPTTKAKSGLSKLQTTGEIAVGVAGVGIISTALGLVIADKIKDDKKDQRLSKLQRSFDALKQKVNDNEFCAELENFESIAARNVNDISVWCYDATTQIQNTTEADELYTYCMAAINDSLSLADVIKNNTEYEKNNPTHPIQDLPCWIAFQDNMKYLKDNAKELDTYLSSYIPDEEPVQ